MQWWGWVILVLAVLVVLFVAFLTIQARRRSGGVIAGGRRGRRGRR
jgi:uncharacterized membrane protein